MNPPELQGASAKNPGPMQDRMRCDTTANNGGGHPEGGPKSSLIRRRADQFNVHEVQARKLIVTLYRNESGMLVAECPAIPGRVSQGKT